jgi:hypothetical protein
MFLKGQAFVILRSLPKRSCVGMQDTRLAEVRACHCMVTDYVSTSLEKFPWTARVGLPLTASPNNTSLLCLRSVGGTTEIYDVTTWTARVTEQKRNVTNFWYIRIGSICRTRISYSPHANKWVVLDGLSSSIVSFHRTKISFLWIKPNLRIVRYIF